MSEVNSATNVINKRANACIENPFLAVTIRRKIVFIDAHTGDKATEAGHN
jgi:hypothetical protein